MGVTINGHALNEIGTLLRAPFPKETFRQRDNDGTWYLPSEFFKDRFDEVIGIMNYDYELKSVRRCESIKGGDSKPLIEVQLTVVIKDDEGVPVKKAEGIGVARSIVVKDTGIEKNPNSDVAIAEQAAFKHLLQNVFGVADNQLSEMNKKGKGDGSAAANSQIPAGVPQGTVNEELTLKTGFEKRGANVYAKASSSSCENMDVVIFAKDIPELEKKMPLDKFMAAYVAGKTMHLDGQYGTFNGKVQFRYRPQQQ